MSLGRAGVVVFSALAVMLAGGLPGCGRSPDPPRPSPALDWRQATLPMPEGEPGRIMLREIVACGPAWYLLGAIGDAAGETRPAVWTSADGGKWTVVRLRPRSYYGERAIFYSGACQAGKFAAVGAKVGGAHGNPRVTTWHQLPDGSLDEVPAEFELYGGPQAINVSRMVAGPAGWMMTGNRYSGAAVWHSADATGFRIHERVPELASDSRGETWAVDLAAMPSGWIVVGGVLGKGRVDRDPMSWHSVHSEHSAPAAGGSAEGAAWRRVAVAGTQEYEEFHRVAVVGGVPYALGLHGKAFGAWRMDGDQWARTAVFGAQDARGIPSVRSLTTVGNTLVAAVSAGSEHQLWTSPDGRSWRSIPAPARMPSGAERAVSAVAFAQRILLLIDDGQTGRLWSANVSVTF